MKGGFYLLILGVLVFTSCGMPDAKKNKTAVATTTTTTAEKITVEVQKPKKHVFEAPVEITGNLEANQIVMIHAMEGGVVSSISKDIGDFVPQGGLIAQLSNPELMQQFRRAETDWEQAKGQATKADALIAEAVANVDYYEKSYARIKAVYDKTPDLITIDELEKAEAQWHAGQSSVRVAEADKTNALANIDGTKAIVDAYQSRVNMLQIRAPFSGYISKRFVDKGAMIPNALSNSNAKPLVELVDLNKYRLVVEYPESDLAYIDKGSAVTISFPEVSGKTFDKTITRVSSSLNAQSKTIRAEIDIVNKDKSLKPGMYAKVSTARKSKTESLGIPAQAITSEKNQNYVYVVNKEGVVLKKPVQLGLEDKELIEVKGNSITQNDLLVVQGKGLISEGTKVNTKMKQ